MRSQEPFHYGAAVDKETYGKSGYSRPFSRGIPKNLEKQNSLGSYLLLNDMGDNFELR